jgi:hypothetical protein
VERAFKTAGFVTSDKLDAQAFEIVAGGIETEAFVVGAHGKIEERMVAGKVEPRELATVKHGVHHVDAQSEVVEESAVPIPDKVAVARSRHKGADEPACRRWDVWQNHRCLQAAFAKADAQRQASP